jgi:hypothetical protein
MGYFKSYIIALAAFFLCSNLPAQNLTGTWEGDMGTYQFLQLNMVQKGDKICGYTWDHLTYDQEDFCKAYFEAKFDKTQRKLFITGTSFFARTRNHQLMQLELTHKYVNDEEVLFHTPTLNEKLEAFLAGEEVQTRIYLKKVADKPDLFLPGIRDCLDDEKKIFDSTEQFQIPVFPGDEPVEQNPAIVAPGDSITITPPSADTIKNITDIPLQVDKRKNIEQSHIEVNVKTINLKVYDNAIVDGDTVSILYNGKLLLSHKLLSEKGIEINVELNENQTRHEITLFAENLGSIPPNTALIVITAGDKRYELFASASLEENAVLVFEYRPK